MSDARWGAIRLDAAGKQRAITKGCLLSGDDDSRFITPNTRNSPLDLVLLSQYD